MNITQDQVKERLEQVMDPELHMSIVDLGLIYKITVKEENNVHILMTLTTLGCPLFHVIENDMKTNVSALGIKEDDIEIEVTFDPPWSMDLMTERAKAMLGI